MLKITAAFAAVLLAGLIGAGATRYSAAQQGAQTELVPVQPAPSLAQAQEIDRDLYTQQRAGDYVQRRASDSFLQPLAARGVQGQPGTWQIVAGKDMMILLNTASGQTFWMGDSEMRWKPIEGQFPAQTPGYADQNRLPDAKSAPRASDPPRVRDVPADRREQNPIAREIKELEGMQARLREKIGELEKKLDNADNDKARKEIQDAIDDLRNERRKVTEQIDKARKEMKDSDTPKEPERR